jgi:hypothetical protein
LIFIVCKPWKYFYFIVLKSLIKRYMNVYRLELVCFLTFFVFRLNSTSAQTFVNPSLEQWAVPSICEVNLAPDFWVNFSNGGLGPDEGNYPICPSTIPGRASDGQVYARFMAGNPRTGEGMAQSVAGFSIGKPYSIAFDYAGSNLWGGSDSMRVHVFLDGVEFDSTNGFSSADTIWRHHAATFIATSTTYNIGVRIYALRFPSAGGSGALDNFGIEEFLSTSTPEPSAFSHLDIFPSVFADEFVLAGPNDAKATCEIFDSSGRLVFAAVAWTGNSIRPELSEGVYEIMLSQFGQCVARKKIVRVHF